MDQPRIAELFQKFAAPLNGYAATSPERKELAEIMVRSLWIAMIAGPVLEAETWEILQTTGRLNAASLQVIQKIYFEQMKSAVSDEEREELRKRYNLSQKKPW